MRKGDRAMMIIVAVLVIVAAVRWLWKRGRLSRASGEKAATQVTQTTIKVTETAKETAAKSRGRLGKVRLPFRRRKDLATQFKEWVDEAALDKRTAVYKGLPKDATGFTDWLQALSDQDLAGFVQELSAFCKGLDFELAWLVDPERGGELKQAVEEAVGMYCLAAWKGREVRPFVTYRAWQSAPEKEENQAFAQQLYSKLVETQLATWTPDLLLASEKERQAYVAEAIEAAEAQDPKAFIGLLREVALSPCLRTRAAASAVVEVQGEAAKARGRKKHVVSEANPKESLAAEEVAPVLREGKDPRNSAASDEEVAPVAVADGAAWFYPVAVVKHGVRD